MKTNKTWTKRSIPADTPVKVTVYKYADGSRVVRLYGPDGAKFDISLDAVESKSLAEQLSE